MALRTFAHHDAEDAFTALVVPQIDFLLKVARTITPRRADAEDLVQDTLVRAFRSIDTFDGAHPRAWLLTILRNTNVNASRRRRPSLVHDPGAVAEIPSPAADCSLDDAYDEAIEAALCKLSERQRGVVTLVDIGGLSYAEAAIVLGVSVGTVMSRLSRARNKLRLQLRGSGFDKSGKLR